jgi:hypothetical protein
MRIFALETDLKKLEEKFLSPGEQHIITAFHHWIIFAVALIKYILITAIIVAIAVTVDIATGAPWDWTALTAFVFWLILVPFQLLKRYIDWRYDFIFVTTTRVITVDQSSIFKQSIKQFNLENFASITSHTQFWNIFPFGKIVFELKEGHGRGMTYKYIPDAQTVADAISDTVALFVDEKPGHGGAHAEHGVRATPPLTTARGMAVMPS